MRKDISLNFDWMFKPDFKEEYIKNDYSLEGFTPVLIPHTVKELPFNNFNEKDYQFVSSYKKILILPEETKGQRLFLHFGAVMTTAEIYLNEEKIFVHEGGFTPFDVEITDYVSFESPNNLFVKVDSHEIKDVPPFGFVVDYLCYGGIYREVSLNIRPKNYIENIFIRTLEAPSLLESSMVIDLDIVMSDDTEKDYDLDIAIFNQGNSVLTKKITQKFAKRYRTQGTVDEIIRWDLDNPKLYDLQITVYENEVLIDQ